MMEESEFLHHAPCEACGSKDNVAVYNDGHSYCFGCGEHKKDVTVSEVTNNMPTDFVDGQPVDLPARGLRFDTCQKFNYTIGKTSGKGKPCQVANYYNADRKLVAQKLRTADKEFMWRGEKKEALLFGQHLWRDKGKMVILTEGEVDAMSVSQIMQHKWPVVSITSGASGAEGDVRKQLEWLEGFESVVFLFDQDKPGIEAALACAKLISPQKAKIATIPLKDANEMLKAKRYSELTDCIWGAKAYKPDGIVEGGDIWNEIIVEDEYVTAPYPFDCVQTKTRGLRKGELVTITAGTGVGKSSFCRHLALNLLEKNFTVGYIALEENIKRTALGIMAIAMKTPLHITRENVTEEELKKTFDTTVGNGKFYLYNHFGSTESDNLLNKIRYLAKGCSADFIVLDHLHMALSSLGDSQTTDERKLIDYTVSKLRTLVEETGVGLILVSHLRRSEGDKGFEDGKEVGLNALRGSASIGQLSDMIISMERNLKSTDDMVKLSILKNRFSGETGYAGSLRWDAHQGILEEANDSDFSGELD